MTSRMLFGFVSSIVLVAASTRASAEVPKAADTLNETNATRLSLQVGDVIRVSVPCCHIRILRGPHIRRFPPLGGVHRDTDDEPESPH